MLLFGTKVDVLRDLVIKCALEFLVGNNAASLFLRSVRAGGESCVQVTVGRDEESVIFSRLECKNPLTHGTRVQLIPPPQAIQKLEVDKVEGKFRPRINCGSTIFRESGGEGRVEAQ